VFHAELLRDLLHINRLAFERERRITCRNKDA
jgi:hypothetical protein